MIEYHKINSIFKRNEKKEFIPEYSCPEFEYLQNCEWNWTEKIDGMNIRIGCNGQKIKIKGRTNNAELSTNLTDYLIKLFPIEKLKDIFEIQEGQEVILFGEAYGHNIQKVAKLYSKQYQFILFDILVGRIYLKRESVNSIAEQLGIKSVPIVAQCSLLEIIKKIKQKDTISQVAENEMLCEGFVGYPVCGCLDRMGRRIITKVKHCDCFELIKL